MSPRNRLGLALAGGGPEGALYEIGALRALDEAIDGPGFAALDVYVGVSAGSFVAACLASGITPAQLYRSVTGQTRGAFAFRPEVFFRPALGELASRGLMLPRLALDALTEFVTHPLDSSVSGTLSRMSRALPVGLFDNEPIRAFLQRILEAEGRTDDFRRLSRKLVVVAADLDSGEAVCFGEPGADHVPISTAVQASTALPGLYPPVLLDGRYYVDGVLLKTLHASVALDDGVDLLFCVNPIVPVDTAHAVRAAAMRRGHLIDRGLPTVLSQTFRTLVHSRLLAGLASYEPRFPEQDVLLVEPPRDDYRMFFTNVFSFAERRTVCEHGYAATRRWLAERKGTLRPMLERHGLGLREDLPALPHETAGTGTVASASVAQRLDRALARLDGVLARRRAG